MGLGEIDDRPDSSRASSSSDSDTHHRTALSDEDTGPAVSPASFETSCATQPHPAGLSRCPKPSEMHSLIRILSPTVVFTTTATASANKIPDYRWLAILAIVFNPPLGVAVWYLNNQAMKNFSERRRYLAEKQYFRVIFLGVFAVVLTAVILIEMALWAHFSLQPVPNCVIGQEREKELSSSRHADGSDFCQSIQENPDGRTPHPIFQQELRARGQLHH